MEDNRCFEYNEFVVAIAYKDERNKHSVFIKEVRAVSWDEAAGSAMRKFFDGTEGCVLAYGIELKPKQ